MEEARRRRANLLSLAILQAILWAAQGTTGCMAEVPIGAIDAGAGGEGATDGTSGSGGAAGTGGNFAKGGTSGTGGAPAGRGGSSGAADPAGGQAGSAPSGTGAAAGSAGNAGGGGVSGTAGNAGGGAIAGTAGSAGEPGGGGTSGTAGNAGSAGSAGSGLSGGDGGTTGGGFAGTAGSAGGWNDPEGPWIIGPPNDIGCTSGAPCTARFQWRDSTIPVQSTMGDYYFRDLSADGQWLTGMLDGGGARQGGFKFTWDATELELLLNGAPISVTAASSDAETLVGWSSTCEGSTCVSRAVSFSREGPTAHFDNVPPNHVGVAVSSDASVMVACSLDYTQSYVYRNGSATLIPGVGLEAISGNGAVFGGRRSTGGAVIVDGTTVIDLPEAGVWIPIMVRALNEDGSVAVGYAEDQSGLPLYPTQAFRWVRGGELELLGIPDGTESSAADDCDASGDLVVGSSYTLDGRTYEPFLYRPSVGLRTLREDLLTHSVPWVPAHLIMGGLRVSADGTRVAGAGSSGFDNIVWVADYLTGPALVPIGDP